MRIVWEILWCVFIVVVIVSIATVANSSPQCMTKREARQEWPRGHLYWHSEHRCWDNKRHGVGHYRGTYLARAEVIKNDSPPTPKPLTQVAPMSPAIIFPNLKKMITSVDPSLLKADPSTLAYRLLDVDEMTSDPPECCWPQLQYDTNGNATIK